MTKLCHIDDIGEDSSKGFELGTDKVFAVKKDGQVFIYRNSCPHLGVELNWTSDQFMDVEGVLIQCFTHGALFLVEDGECVAGPCLGKKLHQLDYEVIDGQIHLKPYEKLQPTTSG